MAVNLSAVALVPTLGAFFLHVIGLATPYWVYVKARYGKYHYGLWQMCHSSCSSINHSADWFKAVRAFAILGALALLMALLVTLLKLRMERNKAVTSILTVLFDLCAAGAILISVAVFAAKQLHYGGLSNFHFSFGFEIIAIVLSAIGGVINVIDMVQSRQNSFK